MTEYQVKIINFQKIYVSFPYTKHGISNNKIKFNGII